MRSNQIPGRTESMQRQVGMGDYRSGGIGHCLLAGKSEILGTEPVRFSNGKLSQSPCGGF